QRRRRDEDELVAEHRERFDQAVRRASVLQIAEEADLQAGDAAAAAADRVEVEERLRRVLIASVAAVDDGTRRRFGRETRRAFARMADDDDVAVALDHADRVGERLALARRGDLLTADPERLAAEAHHRALEREARARRGLEEQRAEDFAVEQRLGRSLEAL